MIQIQDINLGLSVANGIDWFVPEYRTDAGEGLTVVVLLCRDGSPIHNWDNNPIGVKLGIPLAVQSNWGIDDTVIDDFILQAIGATKLT